MAAPDSDPHKFSQVLGAELVCPNLPGCGYWAVFSITVDFGLDVYPFISQTSSRMFILAILLQPGASHTLPSGTLSASIPTVSARRRDLGGSPDVAKPPEDRLTPHSVCSSSRGREGSGRLLERIIKALIPKFYSMDR